MKTNFDEIINRRHSDSVKHTFKPNEEDVIPMWIADMDFKSPPQVAQAIAKVAEFGIFGYTDPDLSYEQAACDWIEKNFDWKVDPAYSVRSPGIVFAIALAIRTFVPENGNVVILEPVYFPFKDTVVANGRNVVVSPLLLNDGKYDIDFEDFENKIQENDIKMFIQCSPQNPIGRVWTKDELLKLGDICLKHNVKVISDEVHCDFVFSGYKHFIFASLSPQLADITITCTAPSKTFNLAGLQASNIIIPNEDMRKAFVTEYHKMSRSLLNITSLAGAKAAYQYGQTWKDDLIEYLQNNVAYLKQELEKTNGKIKLIEPGGTYLMWLDCRELSLSDEQLNKFFLEKAKLWLVIGAEFGIGGSGFMRMNIACPKEILKQAVERLHNALANLNN